MYTAAEQLGGQAVGCGAATIVLDDEESMHLAAQYALQWLRRQPDHVSGTNYGFIVCTLPDGRVTLAGIPGEVLPAIQRAGISFEMMH